MIVVLDTNALHGDVYAEGQDTTTLFEACESGALQDVEIMVPKAVVEELVRQFPARAQRIRQVLGAIDHDLFGFGLQRPDVPSTDENSVVAYRARLEARLSATGRSIVDYPPNIGRAIEWTAQHRHPVKPKEAPRPPKNEPDLRPFMKPKPTPVTGVVDAAIWLTVLHLVSLGHSVAFVTSNTKDFADSSNKSRVHPRLRRDLEEDGKNPDTVELYASVAAFNDRYVAPQDAATASAKALLDDPGTLEALKTEIADAAEWYPQQLDERWGLRTPIDDSTLAYFEPEEVKLIRADASPDGFFMRLDVHGAARFDLGIHKGDAESALEEDISIYDWDFNESMVAAELEVAARLVIDAKVRSAEELAADGIDDREIFISIEDAAPADQPATDDSTETPQPAR
jgi:hypothetical protein